MLYVYFGSINPTTSPREYVTSIDSWFDSYYEKDWLTDGWAERVIREVDKSKMIAPEVVDSPWLGMIPITKISGGAKQLIMAKAVKGIVFNGNNFGDNCFPLLLELSTKMDIMMDLYYYPNFDWVRDIPVTVINTGKVIRDRREFGIHHMLYKDIGFTEFSSVKWPLPINYDIFKPDPWLEEAAQQLEEEDY